MKIENSLENSLNLQVNLRENEQMYLGLADSQEVKTQRTNLLEYLVLQEKQETLPSFLYNNLKNNAYQKNVEVNQLHYSDTVKEYHPYDESNLYKEDVWYTTDEKGRKLTPFLKYNMDKVNYLIQYYTEKKGDMSTYPFEDDTKQTREAYKILAEMHGGRAIDESRLKSVFEQAGVTKALVTVDAKGDITVETDEAENEDVNTDVIKQNFEYPAETAQTFRKILFGESPQYLRLSGEKRNDVSSMYYTGWILNHIYGIKVEDLSVAEDGSIVGLTDEVYNDYDYTPQTDFYINVRKLVARGGSSEDEVGRMMYDNGNIYLLEAKYEN